MFRDSSIRVGASFDVSVVMTVWNGESYLCDAIQSVLDQQTKARWELIVVDDGSTDGSVGIVEEWMRRYPGQIRLLRHPGGANCGISASRNLALHAAKSPLIAFLDCDDVFLPHHLSVQLGVLEQHPEVAMVYASAERWVHHDAAFDEQRAQQAWWGENYIPPLVPADVSCGVLQAGTLFSLMVQDESFAPCMCTVVVRTAAALAVHGFENEFRGLYDDQIFHCKISRLYPVFAHNVCTARYRQHGTSCCARAKLQPPLRAQEEARFAGWVETCSYDFKESDVLQETT